MLTLVVLIVIAISAASSGGGFGWILTAVLAASALILLAALHAYLFHYLPTRQQYPPDSQIVSIDFGKLRDDTQSFGNSLTTEQVENFVRGLLEPPLFNARTVEEITPLQRALRQRVSTSVTFPTVKAQNLLYPVMVPRKGELQDNFVMTLQGDQPVSTLTYSEYLILIAKVLNLLVAPARAKAARAEQAKLDEVQRTAFDLVSRRALPNTPAAVSALRTELNECQACVQEVAAKLSGDEHEAERELLSLFGAMIEKLSVNYVIVAELPASVDGHSRSIVRYERYLVPALDIADPGGFIGHAWDFIRIMLGSRPVYLELPLANASSARSYHLLVVGPEGMHVGWQQLTGTQGVFDSVQTARTDRSPYKRFRKRLGQRYLHLYMRAVPAEVAGSLRLNIRFYETPPGSMGRAAAAATAAFALTYMAGIVISLNAGKTFGSDFPAVVLAFPAVIAVIIGLDSTSNRLLSGTLSARSSSLLTVALALSASGLYMAQTANHLAWQAPFSLLAVDQIWWQVLLAVGLLNMLFSLYVWATRTAGFYWLATRSHDDAVGKERSR